MHLIVILDGFGYEVAKRHKDSGGFKDFHEPSKLIAPYPTLTDLCIQDLLQGERCEGMEAVYFDKKKGKIVGDTLSYLQYKNQPYSKILEFRSPSSIDGFSYIAPWLAFELELNSLKRQIQKKGGGIFRAYLISTAGISTKYAADGQLKCLKRLEIFLSEIKAHTSDALMITLLSDHGHSYYASRLAPIKNTLITKGWNFSRRLTTKDDVVQLSFGLVNYASFATLDAPRLANDLARISGVEIVSYKMLDSVIVLGPNDSSARINRATNACSYEPLSGDPLGLSRILRSIESCDGFYDDNAVQMATIDHVYPSAPERLWRAHFGLVNNPPDVIASLGKEWHSGSRLLNFFATVESTHGSLNRTNSQAFAISTTKELPTAIRSREIMDFLR